MVQDFIKEVLFAKDMGKLSELKQAGCAALPGVSAVILRAVVKAEEESDFSQLKPMLDFAFEKDLRVRK